MNSFTIGLSATLSGRHSVQGRESLKGIKLLCRKLHLRGGIKTQKATVPPPRLIFYDNESSPEKTKETTLRLIEKDKVDVLLGPYSSSLTLVCAEVAAKAGRVTWNYGGSLDDISSNARGKTVTSITEASSYFREVLNMISVFCPPRGEVAVLRLPQSQFSKTVSEGALAQAKKLELSASIYDFESGTKDFSAALSPAKRRGGDCLLCCGKMEDDLNLARWASKNSNDAFNVVVTLAAAINEFKKRLGDLCELFVSTSQWEPTFETPVDFGPSSKEFAREFADKYGYDPDYTAAQAYNMGLIIARLVEKTSSTDEKILMREAFRSEFTTFYGDFRIDPKTFRQTGHRMLVTQWQNGEKKIIFPEECSESRFIRK